MVPSLDLVVWKLGGRDDQYGAHNTGLPILPEALKAETPRDGWQKIVEDGPALVKTLEMVVGAVL